MSKYFKISRYEFDRDETFVSLPTTSFCTRTRCVRKFTSIVNCSLTILATAPIEWLMLKLYEVSLLLFVYTCSWTSTKRSDNGSFAIRSSSAWHSRRDCISYRRVRLCCCLLRCSRKSYWWTWPIASSALYIRLIFTLKMNNLFGYFACIRTCIDTSD